MNELGKNNGILLLYYTKLCTSVQIYWWIRTGVTVRKRSIWVEIGDNLSCVTLKFDWWPWKTTGHPSYTTSSFVHQLKSSMNSNWSYRPETLISGQNWHFLSRVTLKFDGWPRKTIRYLLYTILSFVQRFEAIHIFIQVLQSGNAH